MTLKSAMLSLLVAALFAMTVIPTVDPDLWWHLKTGQVIVTQGIPRVDIFSFTMKGSPWITHEWLSQVFLWLVHSVGGAAGLMVAFALMAVLIFSFVYFTCATPAILSFLLSLFACWTSLFMWGSRPQIFNILMLAVFMCLLENIRQQKFSWKMLYIFPFLTLLWVNLHSGYLLGIIVLFTFLAGDSIQIFLQKNEEGTLGEKKLWHLLIVSALSLVTALANPSGYKIWHYPFETLRSKMMQSSIVEWLAPDFHFAAYKPFLALMIVGAIVFMASRRKRNITEMFLYVATMAAALISRRHIPLFAVVAIPIISRALLDCFPMPNWTSVLEGKTLPPKVLRVIQIVNILLVISALVASGIWVSKKIRGNDAEVHGSYPVEAVNWLKMKGLEKEHGFNDYGWGGYLIWSDLPVFIDGRVDMYGDNFFRQYAEISDLRTNWEKMYKIFSRYNIRYILVRSRSLLAGVFRTNEDWKEVFKDPTASIFLLQTSPTQVPGKSP